MRRKDNAWSYRVDLGPDPATGRRRQLAKQGFRTRKEAETALGALLTSISRGSVVDRSTTTTEEFLHDWLASQQHRLRATTLYSYEKAIERVTRRLGKVPLQALTPLQIEKFYAGLLRDGARLGKPLSAKTVRNSHVVLRKALADAERLGLVFRNAAASARPPTAARKEFATWASDDLRDFFAGIRDDRMFAALLVLATTGMRRGEVLGLRWSDVDLDAGQLAFFELRHETTTALRQAEHDAAADVERRRQHEMRHVGLRQERAAVAADYAPHAAQLADARAVVSGARSRLAAATEHLQAAGLGHRRSARQLVDTTKERFVSAQAALQRVEASAGPVRQRLADLDRQLHDFDPDGALIQILDSWARKSHRHHDLDQLRELDTALNRWQRWASGHPIAVSELDEALTNLESPGASPDSAAHRSLGQAVRSWAAAHGIDLLPPACQVEHHAGRRGMSIEIDL